MYEVKIVADSINEFGCRAISPETTFPRYILAEWNTHRMLSRNSASSRAIPFAKMLNTVKENPFIPQVWLRDHKGMQGTEMITDPEEIELLKAKWLTGRDAAMTVAEDISQSNITKQICNRLLEPFAWHKVLSTATEWENFTAQRAETQAEFHMQFIAFKILNAINESTPKMLQPGQWHLPYADKIDTADNSELLSKIMLPDMQEGGFNALDLLQHTIAKISTGKCANTSYTVIGDDNKPLDLIQLHAIHNKLLKQGHYSPFEHPMRSMTQVEWFSCFRTSIMSHEEFEVYKTKWSEGWHYQLEQITPQLVYVTEYGWLGNVRGYIQYRKLLAGENRSDDRLIKK